MKSMYVHVIRCMHACMGGARMERKWGGNKGREMSKEKQIRGRGIIEGNLE